MDLNHRLAVSYYKTIATINEPHNIFLVQHSETGHIYIKKILDIYNINVYEYLYNHHIQGTPTIIDYYEDNNKLIIIEDYISGHSLQDKINNSKLSTYDITTYMTDLCNILQKLHCARPSIIHRDIKPSNIIITEYNHAVLLDFNAAKFFSETACEDTVLLGTHGYAAPEQYGFGASSPQTDIYALGIVLKEMVESANISNKHLEQIINKCTQINANERYNSITELKNELNRYLPEHIPALLTHDISAYLPPGYRTHTPWKMFISTFCYILIIWATMTLQIKDASGASLWTQRIFVLLIILSILSICFNYMNIRKYVPLCTHHNILIRYTGVAISSIFISAFLLSILIIIIDTCFSQ